MADRDDRHAEGFQNLQRLRQVEKCLGPRGHHRHRRPGPSSCRSAEMSKSPPRPCARPPYPAGGKDIRCPAPRRTDHCGPPLWWPPVPPWQGRPPDRPRLSLATPLAFASASSASPPSPTRISPAITAMVAGMAPAARHSALDPRPAQVSRFCRKGHAMGDRSSIPATRPARLASSCTGDLGRQTPGAGAGGGHAISPEIIGWAAALDRGALAPPRRRRPPVSAAIMRRHECVARPGDPAACTGGGTAVSPRPAVA